jgi:hypothetical protein
MRSFTCSEIGQIGEHRAQVVERVRLGHRLVAAPAGHAGEAQRDAGLVAGAGLDAFEGDLEDMLGADLRARGRSVRACSSSPRR